MRSLVLALALLVPRLAGAAPDLNQARSGTLVALFQTVCLETFPSPERVAELLKSLNPRPASPAEAGAVLQGGQGRAWVVTAPAGAFTVALQPGAAEGCAVAASLPDSEANRVIFGLAVQKFVSDHDLSLPQALPLTRRQAGRGSLTLQAYRIAAGTEGRPELLIDGALRKPDGTLQTRLVRIIQAAPAKPAAATPPSAPPRP